MAGATDICMVETNGIPHLPIIVGGVAKALVHSSRIPVTLIKASNKGEKGTAAGTLEGAGKAGSTPTSPKLKAFSSRIKGLLSQHSGHGYQPLPVTSRKDAAPASCQGGGLRVV